LYIFFLLIAATFYLLGSYLVLTFGRICVLTIVMSIILTQAHNFWQWPSRFRVKYFYFHERQNNSCCQLHRERWYLIVSDLEWFLPLYSCQFMVSKFCKIINNFYIMLLRVTIIYISVVFIFFNFTIKNMVSETKVSSFINVICGTNK